MMNDICYIAIDGRGGSENAVDKLSLIGSKAKEKFGFGEVVVLSAVPPKLTYSNVSVRSIGEMNLAEYSAFVFSKIHLYTDKPYILIYQDDGYALNKDRWNPKFMDYDYIGAPWPERFNWSAKGYKVGNGGFSLRTRKFCEFCSTLPFPNQPEDMAICVFYRDLLVKRGFKFADQHLAKEFSCEHPIDESHSLLTSFGFHGKHNLKLAEDIAND